MTLHERADKLLALREDLYEMHFHQVDREWLIEAMVDFALQLPKQEISKDAKITSFDEISDEEIEKASESITNIGNRRKYWQDGCKWYREQLKPRQ